MAAPRALPSNAPAATPSAPRAPTPATPSRAAPATPLTRPIWFIIMAPRAMFCMNPPEDSSRPPGFTPTIFSTIIVTPSEQAPTTDLRRRRAMTTKTMRKMMPKMPEMDITILLRLSLPLAADPTPRAFMADGMDCITTSLMTMSSSVKKMYRNMMRMISITMRNVNSITLAMACREPNSANGVAVSIWMPVFRLEKNSPMP